MSNPQADLSLLITEYEQVVSDSVHVALKLCRKGGSSCGPAGRDQALFRARNGYHQFCQQRQPRPRAGSLHIFPCRHQLDDMDGPQANAIRR
jgi:hypothetical protein